MKKGLLLWCVLLAGFVGPAATLYADTRAGEPLFFAETGHTLAYGFRQFYERQGGLPIFGLPITEVYLEDGRPVQYFERARLEWHADIPAAQAGHLGRWAAQSFSHLPAFQPVAAARDGGLFFPETGHSLSGAFLLFWERNGGLPTFGYPISEPFAQENAADGQTYTVQYFERARFEHHPELSPGHQVLLGHLGHEYLAAHPAPARAVRPVESAAQAWDAVRPTRIRISRLGIDTSVVEKGYSAEAWDVPRDSAAHYWPIAAYPGTKGNTIISGHVGYDGIIFNALPEVEEGDTVVVTAGGRTHRYTVNEILVLLPEDFWVMEPTENETLTLITCIPIGDYTHRLIVRASPIA